MSEYEDISSYAIVELLRNASHIPHYHSTGLIKIPNRPDSEELFIGSGTFIKVGNIYGILTADHVSKLLDLDSSLGMVVTEGRHRFSVPFQELKVVRIDRGSLESEGPDLAFIQLPEQKARELSPIKGFYDLVIYKDKLSAKKLDLKAGIWLLCGTPNELTESEPGEGEFEAIKSFHGICGAAAIPDEFERGALDYYDFIVLYGEDYVTPSDFGGTSGGGVWQVLVSKDEDGSYKITDQVLSGVIFYQSEIEANERTIRCHAKSSIYDRGIEVIQKMCS